MFVNLYKGFSYKRNSAMDLFYENFLKIEKEYK